MSEHGEIILARSGTEVWMFERGRGPRRVVGIGDRELVGLTEEEADAIVNEWNQSSASKDYRSRLGME